MEAIHQELNILTVKVDKLFQLLETLNQRVNHGLSPETHQQFDDSDSDENQSLRHKYKNLYSQDKELHKEDKDLISDRSILNLNDRSHRHKDFSPEVQIQRLTAQLTAAYNRIAALEEQLLSRRVG
jgi:hypothetical protein